MLLHQGSRTGTALLGVDARKRGEATHFEPDSLLWQVLQHIGGLQTGPLEDTNIHPLHSTNPNGGVLLEWYELLL